MSPSFSKESFSLLVEKQLHSRIAGKIVIKKEIAKNDDPDPILNNFEVQGKFTGKIIRNKKSSRLVLRISESWEESRESISIEDQEYE
jgi:hypothetical protein